MKIPTHPKEREQLLNQLRMAVAFQIKLWDAWSSISEANDCDFDEVMNFVNAMAITSHDGMDLDDADLDQFLGIGVPGRISSSKSLEERERQIH